nr:acanthoscurrin-1-like [Parasteatoda tepidariorum]
MNPLLKFLLMSLGILSCLANIGMTLDTGDLLGGVLGGGGSSGVGGLLGGLLGGGNSGGNSGGNNPFAGKNVECGKHDFCRVNIVLIW